MKRIVSKILLIIPIILIMCLILSCEGEWLSCDRNNNNQASHFPLLNTNTSTPQELHETQNPEDIYVPPVSDIPIIVDIPNSQIIIVGQVVDIKYYDTNGYYVIFLQNGEYKEYLIHTPISNRLVRGQYYELRLTYTNGYYDLYDQYGNLVGSDYVILLSPDLIPYELTFRAHIVEQYYTRNTNFIILSDGVTYWVSSDFSFTSNPTHDYEWTSTPAGEITGYN